MSNQLFTYGAQPERASVKSPHPSAEPKASLMSSTSKKVVLITGASSGFGKETAARLIAEGHTVYPAARRLSEMDDLRAKGGHPLRMDVTSDEDVANGVAQIIAEQGRIDVLINNAGYGFYSLVEATDFEQARRVFEVNVFGTGRVTQAVLPHMREKRSGRIVNISSVVGKVSGPMFAWYAGSKHAVEALSDATRIENKGFGIDVAIVEPGGFRTEFEEVAMQKLEIPSDPALAQNVENFRTNFLKYYEGRPGPDAVVQALVKIVGADKIKNRYPVGDANMSIMMRRLAGDRVFDGIIRGQFKFQ